MRPVTLKGNFCDYADLRFFVEFSFADFLLVRKFEAFCNLFARCFSNLKIFTGT